MRSPGRFAGLVALVTGAARGQGRSHAIGFAREGASLAICDLGRGDREASTGTASPSDLLKTEALIHAAGQRALSVRCDVADADEVESLVAQVLSEFGRIDVLVANAGILPARRPTWQIPVPEWQRVLAVNLTGCWLCNRAVLPAMIEARSGKIINVSSTGGLKGSPGFAGYAAAKWGIIGLTKTLAVEAAPYNINVNAICPGPAATPMILNETFRSQVSGAATIEDLRQVLEQDMLLRHGLITPEAVTDAVLWLASEEARYVTGQSLAIDAGYVAK